MFSVIKTKILSKCNNVFVTNYKDISSETILKSIFIHF